MLTTFLIIILAIIVIPPAGFVLYLKWLSTKPQHSVIRAHPYLGWVRYLLEKLGPEFRQYWFDGDTEGKPFSRNDFLGLVFSAKYQSDLLSFGSKRDFEAPGYYIANDMFPLLVQELRVDNTSLVPAKKYEIKHEGLFDREEKLIDTKTSRWLYPEEDAIVVGPKRTHPWKLHGMFGASATSYGAVGEHYILSTGNGARMAGGAWINTGEGGVAPEHLETGVDVVAQIGPGLFGFRDDHGAFSWDEFRAKAAEPNIKAFELKFAQGAKIRGGHLEGAKVNEKVAAIRKVPLGQTVNSPNRFPFLKNAEDALEFVQRLQDEGGKPVGIKIVVGHPQTLESFFATMVRRNIYPDFITVDGGEGGSGATFKSMADGMGLPLYPALVAVVDAAVRYGVRDKIRIFASGKLISADKVAIALALGADCVNSARGFMMANGCIMAMQCHTGKCPTGVTTTDPKYMSALVPEEKQWRVMNYIVTLRSGVFALAAACGVDSPRKLTREHVVYKNEYGRPVRLSELFPLPEPQAKPNQTAKEIG
ncbi:FMN-binding glutamate synthase family protein [Alicyclobacillus cycloheptanicus]|uniref:Glutamate synthase domain-containing protein 2 n=1 Tax=Alicyclobacillus cycloheptanicus TaxID=1457 RepID=A0ABT9XKS6_9BACL|nr:FMN-binding glutamate synthase family protein [Alicyclobacillus cycloheptanicus]MDQ0190888.1 glutamate synthase domain-containing protein 2 [Alicyclobacillus cycloheptanicus]WDM01774.1 FMN-binding glutamate synthase family protein [Alicyclobacillus cycloheptanicus]